MGPQNPSPQSPMRATSNHTSSPCSCLGALFCISVLASRLGSCLPSHPSLSPSVTAQEQDRSKAVGLVLQPGGPVLEFLCHFH